MREELEQAVTVALKDPNLAASEKSFKEALRRALRKNGSFTSEQIIQLADEFVITEQVRCALLQNEMVRCGAENGCDDIRLLREIALVAYGRMVQMPEKAQMREIVEQILVGKEVPAADKIAAAIHLDLIFPEPSLEGAAPSFKAMKEIEIREQLLNMVYAIFETSLGREKALKHAEEFVLLLLGPPSSEASGDDKPSLLSAIDEQVTLLMKHADDPVKRERVLAGIQEVMNGYAQPNLDAFLFVKLLDTHGKQFLYTVQDALLNNIGTSKDKKDFQSYNLQV